MWPVILGKSECSAGNDRRVPIAALAKPGKTLRQRARAGEADEKAAEKGAAGYRKASVHRQKS
jgi:hypothetical protein